MFVIGSILIPKLLLMTFSIILVPYILPITMVMEFLIIILLNWCVFGSTRGKNILQYDFFKRMMI